MWVSALILTCIFVTNSNDELSQDELWHATDNAVEHAIDEAINLGGIANSKIYLEEEIAKKLAEKGYSVKVKIIRENEIDIDAAFYFDVFAGKVKCRYYLDGIRDPLIGIRLGKDYSLHYRIRKCPYSPYEQHGEREILEDCLNKHYYHSSRDGADFFARLENKSSDGRYYGLEVFITDDPLGCGRSCVDHIYFSDYTSNYHSLESLDGEKRFYLDDCHCKKYGISMESLSMEGLH